MSRALNPTRASCWLGVYVEQLELAGELKWAVAVRVEASTRQTLFDDRQSALAFATERAGVAELPLFDFSPGGGQ